MYVINREQVDWLVNGSRLPFDFDMVVIDELSSFKSHQSKRFRALMKVRKKIQRMVGLTGTPTSNGRMDLWAEFKLLDMGQRLGKYLSEYRNTFFLPDKRNSTVIFSYTRLYCKIYDFAIPAMHCRWWLCHQEPPFILSSQSRWLCSRFSRHCKQHRCLQ